MKGLKKLVGDEWYLVHSERIEMLWENLVALNRANSLLQEVRSFPFDDLWVDRSGFWRTVELSLFESCVTLIYRLVCDPDKKSITLEKFGKKVRQQVSQASEENGRLLKSQVKSLSFDHLRSEMCAKIGWQRQKKVAHLDEAEHIALASLRESSAIRDEVVKDLDNWVKSINELWDTLLQRPRSVEDTLSTQDVEQVRRLLDFWASESELLNLPESNPGIWKMKKPGLSDTQLEILNKYREKFGLPAV